MCCWSGEAESNRCHKSSCHPTSRQINAHSLEQSHQTYEAGNDATFVKCTWLTGEIYPWAKGYRLVVE